MPTEAAAARRAEAERAHLEEHFDSLETQNHAATFGMWVFLATEILFFGPLFTLYVVYRAAHPEAFSDAAGHTDLVLGTVNTYLLLSASFLVAVAAGVIRAGKGRVASALLAGAALLGVVFLALKGVEYEHHLREGIYPGAYYAFEKLPGRGPSMFFALYYAMTGLHALHVLGGIFILAGLAVFAARGRYGADYHTPLEVGGMYWHFVDVVWLFLWPTFYLMR